MSTANLSDVAEAVVNELKRGGFASALVIKHGQAVNDFVVPERRLFTPAAPLEVLVAKEVPNQWATRLLWLR